MISFKKAQRRFKDIIPIRNKEAVAKLGDGNGNVKVDGKNNLHYARVRRQVIVVYNDKTQPINNLEVRIGYEGGRPRLLQVLGVYSRGGVDLPVGMGVAEHHETHEWPDSADAAGGNDIVYVHHRQIKGLRVTRDSGMDIIIGSGWFEGVDNWVRVSKQNLSLTSYIPGSGARWVLIYVDNTGTAGVKQGDDVDNIDQLKASNIPKRDTGTMALAAIKLWQGQTAISEKPGQSEVVDLRFTSSAGNTSDSLKQLAWAMHHQDMVLSNHIINGGIIP